MSVNSYTNSSVVLTNPSTFLRISKDNELLTDVTKTEFGSYVLEDEEDGTVNSNFYKCSMSITYSRRS